jgi:hypothetical protein
MLVSALGPITQVAARLVEVRSMGHTGTGFAHGEFFAFCPIAVVAGLPEQGILSVEHAKTSTCSSK